MRPISFVVPALNEEHYLPTLLQSFLDQKYDGKYELIIVDGGSTDDTIKVAKSYQSRLPVTVYQCPAGVAKQRNYGASQARFDSLVFLDADMKLPRGTLNKLAQHFQAKTNFIASPFLYPYDGKLIDIPLAVGAYLTFIRVSRSHPVVAGMCIVTTKAIHDRIGGFNEEAAVAEDVDYGLRAHKSGARYYILFNVLILGSARRLDKMGRRKLARTWARWYRQTVATGPITEAQPDYEFGKFKKS